MPNLFFLLVCCLFSIIKAEDGFQAWLRYAPLPLHLRNFTDIPKQILVLNSTSNGSIHTASRELRSGLQSILGIDATESFTPQDDHQNYIVIGTLEMITNFPGPHVSDIGSLKADGFWLSTNGPNVEIIGQSEVGALYGTFEYLSMLAQGNFTRLAYGSSPAAPVRWVNQWDNMDGSIERGYGGPSIFFENGSTTTNMSRVEQYARLLSSVRLNGVVINNVNANPVILKPENIAGLARIANSMRPWGVRIGITLNFASPETLGGLSTSDPLDPTVIAWWGNVTQDIYREIPDFLGFTIKASSEGQPGPLEYNRTLADGANLFASAVEPYGGLVLFRAFIYNLTIQFDDWTGDRAKHAVDYVAPHDGEFKKNVIVQIKYGPIDFQVREPASPLFAHLQETPTALELEVSQEYLGQQCHLVYLPPLWRTVMDFDLRVDNQSSLIGSEIVTGHRFNHSLGGYVAVVNVGTSDSWLGSILAMSNLYAFGQLAWNPKIDDDAILTQWTRLSLGLDDQVVAVVTNMSLRSWPA
ncbi:hypothetical protein PFICI_06238 [Pestalotiopsis fici W106-1]|uniref:Alpha-glucuronidase n=1 Tax=Pestalotiopsis fici (strain W106-1 / CGMCC3.15140) TaxID=1229662 RepID=W3X7V6_PESFW|nr:uncharacterized protein PFICI_06238 [Pestalotiopsis fici W106-1]ETS81236.1 hypothetical protein PFICI_06238 [Pestalotiopsis fici W106-1]